MNSRLQRTHLDAFARDGYVIVRGFTDPADCRALERLVEDSLHPPLAPLEFEADVHYPGAPVSKSSKGGFTPRRLLCAYTRDEKFRRWGASPEIVAVLRQLIGSHRICLSQNHHNCVMTKYPGFSSMTSWHQDVRYWRFDRPELVSAWLALESENPDNGGLSLIPGSHRSDLGRGRLDASLFLRTDLEENRAMIDSAVPAELSPGDVVFFHCKTYHAAGRNQTERVKKSLVFTYRAADNNPIPDTRSAVYEDIEIFD
jgi:phytanoyl-CoA hydroxylase